MRFFGWFRPKPKPLDLTPYQGQWVAVRGGKIIAYSRTASGLMDNLISQGKAVRGSTIWFEEHPDLVMRWSVQYASKPGHIFPNCLFSTREAAESWVESWRNLDDMGVCSVWTRDGQHDPWRPAV